MIIAVIFLLFVATVRGQIWPCEGIDIYAREEWGARPPTSITPMTTPVSYIFIHHTVTAECNSVDECKASARQVQDMHMDGNGWNDIGYNFLIGGDGNAYMGRGWDRVGAHTGPNYNARSLAFSLVGNFEENSVPSTMVAATQNLINCAVDRGHVVSGYSLHGHRDAMCTACPGINMYNIIEGWPNFGGQVPDYICRQQKQIAAESEACDD